ncbi:MAG: TetR/AcrR family transcriptional regulator [Bacteroidota bacterium]|nr:TetR/AcrR family transcriptional regulator [Bacteroidota bacterium]
MGTAERKERDRQEMRQIILDAAQRLFLDEGYEHVTIRRIADKIEYSPGTVYLYFKDKDEILCALQEIGFAEFYRRQQILSGIKNPAEKLRAHGRVYIQFALENPELYDLMFIIRAPMNSHPKDTEWEIGMRSLNVLRENVQECMKANFIKVGSVDAISFGIWSLVHGMVSLIIRERIPMIPAEHRTAFVEESLDFVLAEILEKN